MNRHSYSSTRVLMIGDLPPPITGAAKNNRIVGKRFAERFTVMHLNTSANSSPLNRKFGYHTIRVRRNLFAAWQIALSAFTSRKQTVVYHVPNAGCGAVYTLLFALLVKLFSMRCVLHHRSFRYIDTPKMSMRFITHLTRKTTTHLFLSEGMDALFRAAYGVVITSKVVSNSAYVDVTSGHQRTDQDPLVLGHLSNLCREKGIFDVLATFRLIREVRNDVTLLIGGPAMDETVERALARVKDEFGDDVRVTGEISADQKDQFYADIDLFLFPTRYAVEAQPNVIFEALASGCLVAAFDRGCIAEMVPRSSLLVKQTDDFAMAVNKWVKSLSSDRSIPCLSADSLRHSREQKAIGAGQIAQVLELMGQPFPAST